MLTIYIYLNNGVFFSFVTFQFFVFYYLTNAKRNELPWVDGTHNCERGYLLVCYVVGFVDDTDLQLVAFLFLDIFGALDAKIQLVVFF